MPSIQSIPNTVDIASVTTNVDKYLYLPATSSIYGKTITIKDITGNASNSTITLYTQGPDLLENGSIEIPDYKDETVATYGLKYIAEDTGCKSGYLFAIKTIEGKFIGTLGLDYTKRKTKLDNDSINDLEHQSALIGGVLMTHLQQ